MGLIRQVNEISYSLNKQEKARQERENKKILQEDYKKELESDLKFEIEKCLFKNDYNYTKTKKDVLTNYNFIIEAAGKQVAKKFDNFDIEKDLQDIFYKVLKNTLQPQKDIESIKSQEEKENILYYVNILQNELESYFIECNAKKTIIYKCLQKNEYKNRIIDKITSDNQIRNILNQKYYTILARVVKAFKIEIEEEQEQQKELIKQKREAERYRFAKYMIFTREFRRFSKWL